VSIILFLSEKWFFYILNENCGAKYCERRVFWKRIGAEVDGFLFILKRKKGLPFNLLQSKNNLFKV
jgi:hypothetical protein